MKEFGFLILVILFLPVYGLYGGKIMSLLSYSKENMKFCLELDRVRLLLQKAGNPDKKLRIIHVAGTNGKGSVCAFIEAGIVDMGLRCGRFSSPELFSVEDTITIDKVPIGKRALSNSVKKLKPLCDEVASELGKEPSPFEVLFVAALAYFARKRCKLVILECGMGGVGDATNAIESSEVEVLTSIDLDHSEYLGDTVGKIAANKCGILRPGSFVFSTVQNAEAEKVIVERCKSVKCNLGFVGQCKIKSMDYLNVVTDIGFGNTRLSLAGLHQAANAALAARVLQYLDAGDRHILHALTHAENRARMEKIASRTYFDGAHNPAGVKALVRSINVAEIDGKIIFAVGFMADKDIDGCFNELKKLNNNFEIYTATVQSNPRSETSENLTKKAEEAGFEAKSFNTIAEAVRAARKNADVVFAFGSLYMYKELFDGEGNLK